MTTTNPALIWAMIAIAGAGTFLLRFSFLGLLGRGGDVPAAATRALRLVPAAVLAAIVAPAVAGRGADVDLATARFVAAAIAAGVAWRWQNVGLTLASGMVALWLLQAL